MTEVLHKSAGSAVQRRRLSEDRRRPAGPILLATATVELAFFHPRRQYIDDMPLTWTIDPEQRLITVTAKGDVSRAEFEALLDAMRAAGAHAYRKLFDGELGRTNMAPHDALALGVRMRAEHASGPMGPLAVVLPEEYAELAGQALGMLAAADRPMRVFAAIAPARRWLTSLATLVPAGENKDAIWP